MALEKYVLFLRRSISTFTKSLNCIIDIILAMSNKISWINNSLQSSRAALVGPIPYLQWLANYVNCVDEDTYVHMTM